MKTIILWIASVAGLMAQSVTISDTLTNAVGGGAFTGRVTVALNAPGNAQPLYYSTTSLAGWQATYCVGVTGTDCTVTSAAGVFVASLYANSTITPSGTSYAVRFSPSRGAAWSETWVVTPSTTTLLAIRSTTTPTPTTVISPQQISSGGATTGQCLRWSGSAWYATACVVGNGLTWDQLNAITWSQLQ